MSSKSSLTYRQTWWLVFLIMSGPLFGLVYLALTGGLGANPIQFMNRYLGDWGLRALLVALSMTPLKKILGWYWPVRLRRMVGIWAFVYVTLHLTNYIAIDQFFDWQAIGVDIVKRTYITVGMGAFVILFTLAITSTKRSIKRLGGKAWNRIHKYVYGAAILACIHYYMMVKADTLPPIIHAVILSILLALRLWAKLQIKKPVKTHQTG